MGSFPNKKDTLNGARDFQIIFHGKHVPNIRCKGEEGTEASLISPRYSHAIAKTCRRFGRYTKRVSQQI